MLVILRFPCLCHVYIYFAGRWKDLIELAFGVTGLPSAVQATEGDQTPVQEGAGLHEDDPPAQVPGGLRTREGDQG